MAIVIRISIHDIVANSSIVDSAAAVIEVNGIARIVKDGIALYQHMIAQHIQAIMSRRISKI